MATRHTRQEHQLHTLDALDADVHAADWLDAGVALDDAELGWGADPALLLERKEQEQGFGSFDQPLN